MDDKESVLKTGSYYSGIASKAKKRCDDAVNDLNTAVSAVSSCWKGESGDEMAQKLADIKQSLSNLSVTLSSLSSQLMSDARSVYNNWPDEES